MTEYLFNWKEQGDRRYSTRQIDLLAIRAITTVFGILFGLLGLILVATTQSWLIVIPLLPMVGSFVVSWCAEVRLRELARADDNAKMEEIL